MKIKILLIFSIILIVSESCTNKSKYISNTGFVYGTYYNIKYETPDGQDIQQEIDQKFNEYTLIFSTFEKESTISKVNENREVNLEEEFTTCFNKAMEVSEITEGAFDITAAPLINAWGFGPEEREAMTQAKVDSLKAFTGYKKIRLENGKILKDNPNMKLDMSAIAKGYTCDLIAQLLLSKGFKNYLVDIGGEVVAKGVNESGNTWIIGISKPDENAFFETNDIQAKVQLNDKALATSGNYRNFYIEDGKKYAHTIDPKTGYPVQHNLLSSTVLADDCMTADAYATAFMVLGLEKSIELANKLPEIEVYFIYSDEDGNNQIYMSDEFMELLIK